MFAFSPKVIKRKKEAIATAVQTTWRAPLTRLQRILTGSRPVQLVPAVTVALTESPRKLR